MAILTEARLAVWRAIETWSETAGAFARRVRFDGDAPIGKELPFAAVDLPAILIQPVSIIPEWTTNGVQNWPLVLEITIWTADWRLSAAELLVENVLDAIYQAGPDGSSVSYIKQATGYHADRIGSVLMQRTMLGNKTKFPVIESRITLGLRLQQSPFESARQG